MLGAACSSGESVPELGTADLGSRLDKSRPDVQPADGPGVPDFPSPPPDLPLPPPDLGPDGPPDAAVPDLTPSSYLVIITEFMPDPKAAPDANGEWIELYNASLDDVDLDGWTIKDDDTDSYVVTGPVIIPSGARVLLGVDDQAATNGGVTVAHVLKGIKLANESDELVLIDQDGKLVDRVAWDSAWGIVAGSSLQLRDIALDNADATSWCLAGSAWPGSAGDRGTPGEMNVCLAAGDGGADGGPGDAAIDGPSDAGPDAPGPPLCPPPGSSFQNPAQGFGDLAGQTCDYACWGNGTIYNECAADKWQFCLPQGVFASCQDKP